MYLILSGNERGIVVNVYWSSCNVLVILIRVEGNLNYLDRFSKNTEMSNLIKIRPVADELLDADGRMNRHDVANSR
jgi:hypothetical protein